MGATTEQRKTFERAERSRTRRRGPLEFGSVRGLMSWFARSRAKAGGAHGMHPRTQTGADGRQHYIQVDGGRGGDYSDVMAGLITIHAAIDAMRREAGASQHFRAWWLVRVEGRQQNKTAKAVGASEASVSRWVGRLDGELARRLDGSEMLQLLDRG